MERRTLGESGLEVSAVGLGCMGMSEFYGSPERDRGVEGIHRALDLGGDLLDTADMYGPFSNEKLVGEAIRDRRDRVVLATKFGNVRTEDGEFLGVDGRPSYGENAVDAWQPPLPHLLKPVRPVHQVIEVDGFMQGCPPGRELISFYMSELLEGRLPGRGIRTTFG